MTRKRVDNERDASTAITELEKPVEADAYADSLAARAYLTVLTGSSTGEILRIQAAEVVLGRSSRAALRLEDEGVSRMHARIVQRADGYVVEDLRSANGTFVNAMPVVGPQRLADGDKIRLGTTAIVKFSFQDRLDEKFHQRMHQAALRDNLTKAFNRKYFLQRLDSEFAYGKRHGIAVALIMVDVDHLKRINDAHGRPTGDFVLAKTVAIIGATLRAEDVLARYAAGRFGVICRGESLRSAGQLAERLRAKIASRDYEFEGLGVGVTVSIGVAAYPDSPAGTSLELITSAEAAVGEAKRSGRNCVLLSIATRD